MRRLALSLLCAFLLAGAAHAQVRGSSRMPPIDPVNELAMQKLEAKEFAGLLPQRPGQVDAYVLSVGLWDEHVFQHEAEGAAEVLSQRFNAQGRTLVLSNGEGPDAVRVHPGARFSEFGAALGRLGEVMDKDQDVLVLYVVTHGSPDGSLALREQYNAGAIYPPVLRQALDASGIKNRLIILSSCFAASFIPALTDDHTIVIAAAASDRTSFGCQPQNEWTFFGDAFINQAMRQNRPLLDAFEMAKVLVRSWEARDQVRPSMPQSFVGEKSQAITAAMTGKSK